jgi:XTP/dITP diphosphohydrolase
MTKLLIGTNNPGKLREFRALLSGLEVALHTPASLDINLEISETGSTYQENARIKAMAFHRASGLPVLADDTGLEVAALDGAPGLHSRRFSPDPDASDADRRALLLKKLSGKPRPWAARFICTAALTLQDGRIFFAEGECIGEIIPEEHGVDGFGYDSIFLIRSVNRTMADLSMEEKNHLSHRAKAVNQLTPLLRKHL